MAIVVTWYLTAISRDSGSDPTWDVDATSTEATVWFGTPAERLTIDPNDYDIVIVDVNDDGLVASAEIRAALNTSAVAPDAAAAAGFIGEYDIDQDGDPSTPAEATVAYGTNGSIESATEAVLITMDPITITSFEAHYKGGVGNFDPFRPNYLEPACFVAGTMIETPDGPRAIETLQAGEIVQTADNGAIAVRLVLHTTVSARDLAHQPHLRPIRIAAGALGQDLPNRDLYVSPQHRVLVRSKIAQRIFATNEVLVAAKQLLQIDGIDVATDLPEVTYYHLIFDQHEIVLSNGAETESLYPGPLALRNLGRAAREEIYALFPELRAADPETIVAARTLASGRQGRKLASRHHQNHKPLLC